MRKTNFRNIPIRGATKIDIDIIKKEFQERYGAVPTYDQVLNLFIKKHKKTKLSDQEIRDSFLDSRGVKWQ